jgi:hypothetical protein
MRSATPAYLRSSIAALVALALPMAAHAQHDGTLATTSVAASRVYWSPVVGYGCLDLTVTTPNPDQTFQKSFASGEYPAFELPAGSPDGAYRWRLTRSDDACRKPDAAGTAKNAPTTNAVSATSSADDGNGRSAERHGRPDRIPSGPYSQSGHLRVTQGSFVVPSNATERGGSR